MQRPIGLCQESGSVSDTPDGSDHSVEEIHRVALHRSELLVLLRDSQLAQSTIQDRLGVSKTTAYRATRALVEHGLIEKRRGEYALTATGEVAAERTESLCRSITAADYVVPLLKLVAVAAATVLPWARVQ